MADIRSLANPTHSNGIEASFSLQTDVCEKATLVIALRHVVKQEDGRYVFYTRENYWDGSRMYVGLRSSGDITWVAMGQDSGAGSMSRVQAMLSGRFTWRDRAGTYKGVVGDMGVPEYKDIITLTDVSNRYELERIPKKFKRALRGFLKENFILNDDQEWVVKVALRED